MTEDIIFHDNLKGDKGQDVINELAGHELSHQWWGVNQLVPDDREGSKLLTETLVMYTELMLVKYSIGQLRVLDNFTIVTGIPSPIKDNYYFINRKKTKVLVSRGIGFNLN